MTIQTATAINLLNREEALTKQRIKRDIESTLYNPIVNQLSKQINSLIARNTHIYGYSHSSFKYKGEIFSDSQSTIGPRVANKLSPKLYPQMEEYLADSEFYFVEKQIVMGYVTQVLNISYGIDDYFYLLPEALHEPVKKVLLPYPDKTFGLLSPMAIELHSKSQALIQMIKQRLMSNLLI